MLAPFLSVVIYGLLGICSFFKLLVYCVFENYFFERKRLSTTNFVMFLGLVENVYKVFLKNVFERVLCMCKSLFCFEQASKNYLLYSKGCSFPLFL